MINAFILCDLFENFIKIMQQRERGSFNFNVTTVKQRYVIVNFNSPHYQIGGRGVKVGQNSKL